MVGFRAILRTLCLLGVFCHGWGADSARILSYEVVDGDSVKAVLSLGFDVRIVRSLRIAGVDTPEIRPLVSREAATVAKRHLEHWMSLHSDMVFTVTGKAKYAGRSVGSITAGGVSAADYLLEAGVAKAYEGGKKEGFSAEELAEILLIEVESD